MIHIHPTTRQRILFMAHAGDVTYDLSGDPAVAQEDVPVIGAWTDWTGSGGTPTATQQQFASKENSLQGNDADIDGKAKLPNLSVIGTREQTHRRRTIKVYLENKDGQKC
jgi:hypothetical protein